MVLGSQGIRNGRFRSGPPAQGPTHAGGRAGAGAELGPELELGRGIRDEDCWAEEEPGAAEGPGAAEELETASTNAPMLDLEVVAADLDLEEL